MLIISANELGTRCLPFSAITDRAVATDSIVFVGDFFTTTHEPLHSV